MNKAEEQKAIELFDNIISNADNNLLKVLRARIETEIRLSEIAIKEGFEENQQDNSTIVKKALEQCLNKNKVVEDE